MTRARVANTEFSARAVPFALHALRGLRTRAVNELPAKRAGLPKVGQARLRVHPQAGNGLTGGAIPQNLSTEDSPQNRGVSMTDPAGALGEVWSHPDSLAVRVREYLLAEVTSGRMEPGARINEAELARKLGISRNPIREAISGLVQKGFLVARPRRGAELRRFSPADIDDIFAFRVCIEQFALDQAMAVMTAAEKAEFPALVDRMRGAAAAGDVAAVQNLDLAFHRGFCEFSRSRAALRAFDTIDTEVRILIASVDLEMETLEASAERHGPLADAIAAGDGPKARAELALHIAETRHLVRQALAGSAAGGDGADSGRAE